MSRTQTPLVDDGVRYAGKGGNFLLTQLADLTWQWVADNHTFVVADYNAITDEEITLPYYREALKDKVTADEIDLESYVAPTPPPAIPDEFRLWYHMKDRLRKLDKTLDPFTFNFTDKGVMKDRLHEKVWKVDGHVVQIIHYAELDEVTQVYSVPVVLERWYWALDAITHLSSERVIKPQGYRNIDDLTDPENPIPVLLPLDTENISTKKYPKGAAQFKEIARRRENVVDDLKEKVVGFLAYLQTAGDVAAAIALGQAYIRDVQKLIDIYVSSGLEDLASETESGDAGKVRTIHTWLDIDLTPLGIPMTMYSYIALVIRSNPSTALLAFDYDTLPDF